MPVTHIFFDLHGTLIDSIDRLPPCWKRELGRFMAARYGLTPEVWSDANQRIIDDWDSYYADLDLGGDDGLAHMWEGIFRTTRALFRLTGAPEPDKAELLALCREFPGLITQNCDAFFPDVKPVIEALAQAGYVLGIASHAIVSQARGLLTGGGVADYFAGPIIGPDVSERFVKDEGFYRYMVSAAKTAPAACLVVDDDPRALRSAKAVGLSTAWVCRGTISPNQTADHILTGGLETLPALMANLNRQITGTPHNS